MGTITIKTDRDKADKYNDTTVSGGGYVRMSIDDYTKYAYPKASPEEVGGGNGSASGVIGDAAVMNGVTGTGSGAAGTGNNARTSAVVPGGAVAARDYVTGRGYSGIVDWDGDNVTIGGFAVAPSFVKDGTAYVPKTAADYAIQRLEEKSGINKNVSRAVEKKYGKAIDEALNALLDQGAFAYDPGTDPVFEAYKEMYEREGEDAYRRVLNDNNTSVTGASGAVLSEAMAARSEYSKKLSDVIPELAGEAYKRYTGERERLSGSLNALTALADSYYDRLYSASRDSYNDIINAGKNERAFKQQRENAAYKDKQLELSRERLDMTREQNRINNERNEKNDRYKNALNALDIEKGNIELEYYPRMLESEIYSNNLSNSSAALNNALMRGFFTAEDEAALPWLSGYRTDSGYSINPQLTQAAYEYHKEYNKKRAEINAIMGW